MNNNFNQKIENELKNLPEKLQLLIKSSNWEKITEEIGKKKNLTDSEINDLQIEVSLVLIGLEYPEDFSYNIESNVVLSKKDAEEISMEVENKIFSPVWDKFEEKEDIKDNDSRFDLLPEIVKNAINSSGWKEKLYEITAKYKLSIEEMGKVEESTVNLMLNKIDNVKFEEEISSLNISKENSANLIDDINNNILKKIRELMRENKDPVKLDDEVPIPPYKVIKESATIEKINQPEPAAVEIKPNIIQEKLEKPVVSDHKVSDYSLPKTSFDINKEDIKPAVPHDPYREII